jgi:uncharacterized protein
MKSREFVATKLDVAAFAKESAELEGRWPLAELDRLMLSVRAGAPDAEVIWRARGERREPRGAEAQTWLHVHATVPVTLECQRCLGPVSVPLHAERSFLFVADEAAAAALDGDLEDDVLVLPRALDVRTLVEDELLLALPLVPRHDTCPQPLVIPVDADVPEEEPAPHPFAALAALKRGGLSN